MSAFSSRFRALPAWFYLAALALLCSFLLPLPRGGKIEIVPSLCSFYNLTHLPCPGCGLTRSWVCAAHGHILEAFRWHPLGPILWLLTVVYLVLVLAKPDWKPRFPAPKLLIPSVLAIFLFCWFLRLNGIFSLPSS